MDHRGQHFSFAPSDSSPHQRTRVALILSMYRMPGVRFGLPRYLSASIWTCDASSPNSSISSTTPLITAHILLLCAETILKQTFGLLLTFLSFTALGFTSIRM